MNMHAGDRWLFDLGNSRLKYAPWRAGTLGPIAYVDHDGHALASDWEQALPVRIDAACVASVAPPALTSVLVDILSRRSDRVDIAHTLPSCAGVRIAYAHPERLGVDRFLALLGAYALCVRQARGQPALVVGVGTGLTVDLLDADGLHRGGRIAPSPTLMREMLQARAPQLPATGGDYTEFADDTVDALASGCEGAALGLVERSRNAASALLGATPSLLLHGGGATALQRWLPEAIVVPALVLEGLVQWARARD